MAGSEWVWLGLEVERVLQKTTLQVGVGVFSAGFARENVSKGNHFLTSSFGIVVGCRGKQTHPGRCSFWHPVKCLTSVMAGDHWSLSLGQRMSRWQIRGSFLMVPLCWWFQKKTRRYTTSFRGPSKKSHPNRGTPGRLHWSFAWSDGARVMVCPSSYGSCSAGSYMETKRAPRPFWEMRNFLRTSSPDYLGGAGKGIKVRGCFLCPWLWDGRQLASSHWWMTNYVPCLVWRDQCMPCLVWRIVSSFSFSCLLLASLAATAARSTWVWLNIR